MKISVDLQEPFAYLPVWIILGLALVASALLAFFIARKKLKAALQDEKKLKVKKVRPEGLPRLKQKYVGMLDKITWEYHNGQINSREAYQRMSKVIRLFVHRATGVRVQNCTLSEIRALGMPQLSALVEEYYEPEFARNSAADAAYSIQNTRRTIELWY